MDQAPANVERETEKPQNQKNDENCPKHFDLQRSCGREREQASALPGESSSCASGEQHNKDRSHPRNHRPNDIELSGSLLLVFFLGFFLGFRFPLGYGLSFRSANFCKERLHRGWS
jgi:hypothetical protein